MQRESAMKEKFRFTDDGFEHHGIETSLQCLTGVKYREMVIMSFIEGGLPKHDMEAFCTVNRKFYVQ